MRNDVTIVTALFNIEREGMDGRDWEEYLKWFTVTLQLKCPMTVFVTEDLVEFVKEKRGKLPQQLYSKMLRRCLTIILRIRSKRY